MGYLLINQVSEEESYFYDTSLSFVMYSCYRDDTKQQVYYLQLVQCSTTVNVYTYNNVNKSILIRRRSCIVVLRGQPLLVYK